VLAGTTALGVQCGSAVYWGAMSTAIPLLIGIAIAILFYLVRQHRRRERAFEYPWVKGDIKWTHLAVLKFMIFSLMTAVLSATFGIGGGTLNGPTMLELGVLPAVVPSTSGFMILITSSIALIQYYALGTARWDYGLWFAGVGFIGGISGHLGIRYYVKRWRKQAALVFLLTALVFAGLVVLVENFAASVVANTAQMALLSPCGT